MEQDLIGIDYSTDRLLGQRVPRIARSLWSYGGGRTPKKHRAIKGQARRWRRGDPFGGADQAEPVYLGLASPQRTSEDDPLPPGPQISPTVAVRSQQAIYNHNVFLHLNHRDFWVTAEKEC